MATLAAAGGGISAAGTIAGGFFARTAPAAAGTLMAEG
jgi:hypothetical protein